MTGIARIPDAFAAILPHCHLALPLHESSLTMRGNGAVNDISEEMHLRRHSKLLGRWRGLCWKKSVVQEEEYIR